jgi:hypothetical protein
VGCVLTSNVKRSDLEKGIPSARPGRISFLTLTNHFYSKAAPLPQGKGMYPRASYQIPACSGSDCTPAAGLVPARVR